MYKLKEGFNEKTNVANRQATICRINIRWWWI